MALARAHRQFEVFDIAIVAVVTKALGAFIVLMIMLLPYYRSDPTNAPAVQAVEDYLGEIRKAIEAVQRGLNEPTIDRTAIDKEIKRSKDGIEEAQQMVQGVRSKLDQAKSQIDRLEANERKLEDRVAGFDAELGRARDQLAGLQSEKDTLAQANRNLTAENQSMRQQLESLQRDLEHQRAQGEAARQQLSDLRAQMESLQERTRRTEDPSLVMRWFSVGLAIPECSDMDFSLYVRWDGPLRNASTGKEMPGARPFSASRPEQRTPLLGHRYFDLGAKNDIGSLSEKALQQGGLLALGKTQTQIKLFQAVSRAEGNYSVYVVAKDPQALKQRQCAVHPYYLSWSGATLGEKIVLSQKRPYAWLRRFRINKDGSSTLALPPIDDDEFQSELEEFSNEQSRALCVERRICGTEDAHRFALRVRQRGNRAAPE